MKSESYKKREEELKVEYENFLKTKEGQEWKECWVKRYSDYENIKDYKNIKDRGCFGDYLYDFYPKMLM